MKITWATASEKNNDYFTIERSSDGTRFEPIQKINGSGNISTYKYYEAMDTEPLKGTSYYRLKQTDYDGKFEYFQPASVNCNGGNDWLLFPNPSNSENVNLQIGQVANKEIEIIIYNLMGEKVVQSFISFEKETSKQIVFSKKLSPGIYIFSATNGIDLFIKKLVVY